MPDLGNKFNPVLAGLTGLGEGFFQGYLARQQFNQEERKNELQQQRLSMLDLINQRQWEAEFNQRQQYQNSMIEDRKIDNERISSKPIGYVRTTITEGDVEKTYQIPKGSPITPDMKPIAVAPRYKETSRMTDPLIAERRQQLIDDAEQKRQANLEKSIADTDLLIAKTKGGLQTVGDKVKKSGYIGVGENNKSTFIEKEEWRAKARGSVNSTVNKLKMQSDVTNLWIGAKQAAKRKYGKDLDSVDSADKRNFLKSIVDNSEVPETKKKVLYQYIEIYTR